MTPAGGVHARAGVTVWARGRTVERELKGGGRDAVTERRENRKREKGYLVYPGAPFFFPKFS